MQQTGSIRPLKDNPYLLKIDRWGHTALQEAERGNHTEVAQLLRDAIIKRSADSPKLT